MKYQRKIIEMDYRGQTSETKGMFAEQHWPRDDETLESGCHRSDIRVRSAKAKADNVTYISKTDTGDINTSRSNQGRNRG